MIDHVTLWRHCRRATQIMAGFFEPVGPSGVTVVDTTSISVATTDVAWYSGHKKRHVAKIQVVCDLGGAIRSVSRGYPGSIHDKTIWNDNFNMVQTGGTRSCRQGLCRSRRRGQGAVSARQAERTDMEGRSGRCEGGEPCLVEKEGEDRTSLRKAEDVADHPSLSKPAGNDRRGVQGRCIHSQLQHR